MRTIIRAGLAIVVILAAAHWLDYTQNNTQMQNYKDRFIQNETIQNIQNSAPAQKLSEFELDQIIPYDAL